MCSTNGRTAKPHLDSVWVESKGEYVSGCWYIEDCASLYDTVPNHERT